MKKKQFDFRRMSFYQIWIRSFCDGNGDGIGDLYGVYDKLEYIKSLGVDGIWFSPIFPSPNADYGYDISDYKNIHPEYGTLEQFRKVLDRAHELGMKVLLDLVINHTSDEHPWFIESCKGKDNPYSDYYIWRDPVWKRARKKRPPNNWFSQFEGLAWEYSETRGQYYLHIFARKQPDLNMDNPKVREEVKSIMRFWLDMGVDGFREDVINFISKDPRLPDGLSFIPAINGLPFYKDGPNLHRYLQEFRETALSYGAVQIGEAPFTGIRKACTYIAGRERVLDMVISFDAMMADCFMTEYIHHGFRLRKLKRAFSKWQYGLQGRVKKGCANNCAENCVDNCAKSCKISSAGNYTGNCAGSSAGSYAGNCRKNRAKNSAGTSKKSCMAWNALYLENHDHPRVVSRYGSLRFWRESATMLAASYIFQRGTPFIYQGQELGMTNIALPSIDDYNDVASRNAYHTFHLREPVSRRLERIHISSRDSARTPVQWTAGPGAGFTTGTPWFHINPNYMTVNAESEEKDPASILNFYRKCLKLRRSEDALLWGTYREYFPKHPKLYMYERCRQGRRILVVCSFSEKELRYRLPLCLAKQWRAGEKPVLLLDNYETVDAAEKKIRGEEKAAGKPGVLRPYEAQVWKI